MLSLSHADSLWPCQAPLSMGIHLPNPGIEPKSHALQVDSFPSEPPGKPKKPIPFPGDLSDPGIKPGSPALQVDSLPAELPGKHIFSFRSLKTANVVLQGQFSMRLSYGKEMEENRNAGHPNTSYLGVLNTLLIRTTFYYNNRGNQDFPGGPVVKT